MTLKKQILEILDKNSLVFSDVNKLFLFISDRLSIDVEKTKKLFYALLGEGEIYEIRKNKFITIPSHGYVKGEFFGTAKGFGFVKVDGFSEDIFIPANKTNNALDGEGVIVKILSQSDGGTDGEVASIFKELSGLVGTIEQVGTNFFLQPDNNKICFDIPLVKTGMKLQKGQKVLVRIVRTDKGKVKGITEEILGFESDVKALELSIIRDHNLFENFSPFVEEAAKKIPQTVPQSAKKGRLDLTGERIFTIDGADAKDLDDAVHIKKFDKFYELGVHIADVGQYVPQGSVIDEEAFNRGTSVYFPTSVLPMLPKQLSNGICSLNEGVERLTLSCIMKVDFSGKVVDYKICESVIKSVARLTYDEVFDALVCSGVAKPENEEISKNTQKSAQNCEKNAKKLHFSQKTPQTEQKTPQMAEKTSSSQNAEKAENSRNAEKVGKPQNSAKTKLPQMTPKAKMLQKDFVLMRELCDILERNTTLRGALDLDVPEVEFVFDENGMAVDLTRRNRNEAHRLIEDFMVLANETIAKHFYAHKIPFVYRVHEAPTLEKVYGVCDFLKGIGVRYPKIPDHIQPKYFQEILQSVENLSTKDLVNKIVLRSMQKAKYSNENLGHFGLALTDYCHFTSPIRRYPDLTIHRIIKQWLHSGQKMDAQQKAELEEFVFEAAMQSSQAERNADYAERDVDDLWKAYLMKDRVGETFDASISSVTNFGIFVSLPNTVEGLVRVEDLPQDGYLFLEKQLKLKGAAHTFSIGDHVKVVLANVNLHTRNIDFKLA